MKGPLYNENEMAEAMEGLAAAIAAAHPLEPVLIGIRRGGVVLGDRLAEIIGRSRGRHPAQGIIDINLYRDDWTRARALPRVGRTEISFSLDDRRVILVDDVLFTGRTARAALEALASFGRPARVELAVLVDRGHREMPIQADYVSFRIPTTPGQRVNVHFRDREGRAADAVVLEEN